MGDGTKGEIFSSLRGRSPGRYALDGPPFLLLQVISMNLIVSNYGSFIGKTSERLVVKKGQGGAGGSLFDLKQVTITTAGPPCPATLSACA